MARAKHRIVVGVVVPVEHRAALEIAAKEADTNLSAYCCNVLRRHLVRTGRIPSSRPRPQESQGAQA